ncbi:DUF3182 family protein [Sphingomonas sanxanigenens]|uniref:Biotin carboxylase n=1 Tax=Sphingomonas sanxanigenens DSM 19645 = NX02 TaxID=1123269 RepID=W0AK80_9SPHN|nr:DUF3182 family protein [Sphingomonas sanxanigenens]AHE56070.1 hypothetical protein NX02_22235 [Sphingomonas sanxanigenens DSM 19645 = NX02]
MNAPSCGWGGATLLPGLSGAPLMTALAPPVTVMTWRGSATHANAHDRVSRRVVARHVAALLDLPFGGEAIVASTNAYVVPFDTLIADEAALLGVAGEDRLLGGVVPHRFVATKAITHPLIAPDAAAPEGWAHELGSALAPVVPIGFTAFSTADVRRAGETLLALGPLRLKAVAATAGLGQTVVEDRQALERALAAESSEAIEAGGIVLEENLADVTTYSVGTTRIGAHAIAYWGTQRLTRSNAGDTVYGGSDLEVVRGGWDELAALPLAAEVAQAVRHAIAYDRAVFAAYPGLCASRRNYDIIAGDAADGTRRIGVLEQSWRVGGATGAELAAIEAFARDSKLGHVRSSTMEIYGRAGAAPAGATIYYDGVDPVAGPLTKYAEVSREA